MPNACYTSTLGCYPGSHGSAHLIDLLQLELGHSVSFSPTVKVSETDLLSGVPS